MKKKFIKTPLKGVYVHGAKDVGTRTVNLLMGEHAGEYVRGDIMDANAVIQAFDELKGNVDNNHDSLEEIVNEIHNFRDTTNHRFDVFQEKAEEETANRIQGDNTLDDKIDQKEIESNERDNVLQQNINTEKQERVNADTQLRNDLTAEVNRAKANENALSSDIHAEATKRENDDNTIKDNLNAEVTRATAKENEIKAEVDVINGDSTTEGSFRKAIADVVGAAPEAYDTLKEIADKLNSNDDLHTAINDAIATKATIVALNEEITRAKAAEAQNKAEIAAEAARAKEVEGDNALAIQNEASRATTAETAINESLNTEIDRAKGQEAYLQNLVNAKADTTAFDSAKAQLDKKISDETTRATGVEATKASADDLSAEVTRAKQAEADITSDVTEKLAQKADTTALNNYVLTTAFNEQVGTLNAAIDTKQPKGNYLTEHQDLSGYVKMTSGVTEILDDTFDEEYSEANINKDSIVINNGKSALAVGDTIAMWGNEGHNLILKGDSMYFGSAINDPEDYMVQMTSNSGHGEINLAYAGSYNDVSIGANGLTCYERRSGRELCRFNSNGITSYEHNNCLATSDGTFKPISDFALKTELPTVPTKVSQLTNDSNFITAADVDFTPYATTEALTAVEQKVDANTAAISAKQDAGNYIPYNDSGSDYYQTDKNLTIKVDDANTANFGPNSCIHLKSGDQNTLSLTYGGLNCKVTDQNKINIDPQSIKLVTGNGYTFSVNPSGINQVTNNYKFDVSSSVGIKWSTPDDEIYSNINHYGLFSRIQNYAYANCNSNTFVGIKNGNNEISVNPTSITATNGTTRIEITPEFLTINDGNNNIQLYKGGILLPNGDNNHVLTSSGSTIDISQYAKKTDLPKMQFVSSLPETTDSNTLYFVI